MIGFKLIAKRLLVVIYSDLVKLINKRRLN